MGITRHAGFGYGLMVPPHLELTLRKHLAAVFAQLPPEDFYRKEGIWFTTDPEDLFLEDALEEYFEKTLVVTGGTDSGGHYRIYLFAKSTYVDLYGAGAVPVPVFGGTPTVEETEVLKTFSKALGDTALVHWWLFAS